MAMRRLTTQAPEASEGNTQAEQAAAALQRAIISGDLSAGTKLRIRELQKRFGFGATPLREGLSRLVSAGFVRANSQRGFSVVPTSREDLQDILRVRTVVECEALRLAMQRGGDDWEAGIVARLHQMRRALEAPLTAERAEHFNTVHLEFHTALLAGCGSPRMMDPHRTLFDQTFRYRQFSWEQSRHSPQRAARILEEHQQLADAAMAGRVDKAQRLLTEHLGVTLRLYDDRVGDRRARR